MRPLQLTMSAFGPYAGETVLDFAELGEQNIFVITGPTGAGKTTIFDAICYAFYGETSGAEREVRGLRSDFVLPGAGGDLCGADFHGAAEGLPRPQTTGAETAQQAGQRFQGRPGDGGA